MITEFKNEYEFLSNFHRCSIKFRGADYLSVEHAYQSAKSTDMYWKSKCQSNLPPRIIKKDSRAVDLIPNWDLMKIDIMRECLKSKFSDPYLKQKLIDTDDVYLREGNVWNDTFWGYCLKTNKGKNVLGCLLMEIRNDIKFGIDF